MTLVQVGRVVYEAPLMTARSAQDVLKQQLRALGEKIASGFPEGKRRVMVEVVVWTGTSLGESVYRQLRVWCSNCRGSGRVQIPGMVLLLVKQHECPDEVERVLQRVFRHLQLTPEQQVMAQEVFYRTLGRLLTKREQRRWDRIYLDYHFALRETADFKRASRLFDFSQSPAR